MKYLKAAATVRIFDSLGVVSKEVHDIRNKSFLINKNPEIYSGKVNLDNTSDLIFLFTEKNDIKYMITTLVNNTTNNNWFCFIGGDIKDEDPELNKIYSTYISNDETKFREVSFFEVANILRTYELIRDNVPFWMPFEYKQKHIDIIKLFVDSFDISEL